MTTVILCSLHVKVLKRWFNALKECEKDIYVARQKDELFYYFNSHKDQTVLLIDNINEEDEEFLALLKRSYPWVLVCVLSNDPNVKQANRLLSLGVKAYANVYMKALHVKNMYISVKNKTRWYLPMYLQAYKLFDEKKTSHVIGKIQNVQNLVMIKNDEEERIAFCDEDIFENELVFSPYENSSANINIDNEQIFIANNDKIFFDKTTFINESLDKYCIISDEMVSEILSQSGHVKPKNKQTKQILHANEVQKNTQNNIQAAYSGNFDEYEIYLSKNISGFIVIKDKQEFRDGSDLISEGVGKLIFKDLTTTYNELLKIINK